MTFDIELQVQVIRQEVTALTAKRIVELIPIIAARNRARLWTTMMRGHFVQRPSPRGRHLSNPLLIALRHIRDLPGPGDDEFVSLPDPLHTLLLANCDPNEMSQGMSPLCQVR